MRVWVAVRGALEVARQIDWRPLWGALGEVPLLVNSYCEGEMTVYGSGRVVVSLWSVPIKVTVPCQCVRGVLRLSWPGSNRKGDVMALRRIQQQAASATAGESSLADRGQWPFLVEYLTTLVYDDGTARQPSSLVIVADASNWRGCVTDKDNDRTLWRTAASLEGLLLELEEALAKDDPSSWRQAGGGFRGRKKRS